MATTTRLTIEDFERLPLEQVKNHELVDGELVAMSGNNWDHNGLRDLLIRLLDPVVREQRLGRIISEQEYDFDGNAHAPDVSFIVASKLHLSARSKRVQRFVPDLAIEIVSPNDTFQALVRKKERYRQCGTQEIWILSQDTEEVYVYSTHGDHILRGNDRLASALIPGFSITVAGLFMQAREN